MGVAVTIGGKWYRFLTVIVTTLALITLVFHTDDGLFATNGKTDEVPCTETVLYHL